MKNRIVTLPAALAAVAMVSACAIPGQDQLLSRTFSPAAPVTFGKATFPSKIETKTIKDGEKGHVFTEKVQYVLVGGRWTPCGVRGIAGTLCNTPEAIEQAVKTRATDAIQEEGHSD